MLLFEFVDRFDLISLTILGFRALPFPEGTDINGLVEATADGSRHIRPQIQDEMKLHPDLVALLIDCWCDFEFSTQKHALGLKIPKFVHQFDEFGSTPKWCLKSKDH